MSARRVGIMLLTVAGGLLAVALLIALLPVSPVQASPGVLYVTVGTNCGDASPCYQSIQTAIDAAAPGDEIRIAGGHYRGLVQHPGLSQVIYISKTITLRGGYAPTNWLVPDPEINITLLDAEGLGRVAYITGAISPTLEHLHFTGGNATLQASDLAFAGGGVYIREASASLLNCEVYSNTASAAGLPGYGGGLFLYQSDAILIGNNVWGNTASKGSQVGYGGGVSLVASPATLRANALEHNTAARNGEGYGGGLHLQGSDATLQGNRLEANTASQSTTGYGGGVYLSASLAQLSTNLLIENIASRARDGIASGFGGGLYAWQSNLHLVGNTAAENSASLASNGYGAGMALFDSTAMLYRNRLLDNTATLAPEGEGSGGGLFAHNVSLSMDANQLVGNLASASSGGKGGGVYLSYCPDFTLTNNLIARNRAGLSGAGLYLAGASTLQPNRGLARHTTLADNDGQGVYLGAFTNLVMTNTIIAGHTDTGVMVDPGGSLTLDGTLWYSNSLRVNGDGLISSTQDLEGDPAFADPLLGDYHLTAGSAAIDQGLPASDFLDFEAQPRLDGMPDLGVDEYWAPGALAHAWLPCMWR